MVAGAAHAGAWEEFERRCLVPMENVEEPLVSDLEMLRESTIRGGKSIRLFFSKDFVMSQWVDEKGTSVGCTVGNVPGAPAEQIYLFSDAFDAWKRAKVSSGEYANPEFGVERDGLKYNVVLHSNMTREPVLRVGLFGGGQDEILSAIVMETDLES